MSNGGHSDLRAALHTSPLQFSIGREIVRCDGETIRHDLTAFALDDIDGIAYWQTNVSVSHVPTHTERKVRFTSGRSKMTINCATSSLRAGEVKDAAGAQWQALVQIATDIVEPSIRSAALETIRQGGTFKVGDMVLGREGFKGSGVFTKKATWDVFDKAGFLKGEVHVIRTGKGGSFMNLPMTKTNAVVLPGLMAACARAAAAGWA